MAKDEREEIMGYNYEYKLRKGESVERAVKRFSRKCKKLGIIQDVRDRRHYQKPSDKKRLAKKRAIARHKKELAKQRR
jgi:small subunit ribosomal protein S21|tara:strand:- start:150 stop:383 length:234 start_codon:yes stop_codon:yes gene_type:complete